MIRINLLPIRKAKRAEAGQRQFLYMGLGILATIGGVVLLHLQTDRQLAEATRKNSILQADVARLKQELGDYDKIRSQREELLRQRKTIQALDQGRTGPVYLLREMSEILSPGKGPTFDRVTYEEQLRRDPNAGFNASWDTRRVWFDGYTEVERAIRLKGAAKSNEDVAEFLKRLNSSVFFSDVNLDSTAQQFGRSVKFVSFSLSAKVIYYDMNDILQKLLRLKTPVKIAVTAGLMVMIVVLYVILVYLDMQDQIKAAEVRARSLVAEKENYEKRKKEYIAYRNELTQLQQEQRDLLKALPKKAEIPTFLSSIQEQAELAGLEVLNLAIESESPAELYVRIPVRIEIRGSYHTITKFFKNVADLSRIVNVENLSLSIERQTDENTSPRLRARFYAVTFRYLDQPGGGGT